VLISVGNSIKMLTRLVPDLIDGAAGVQRVNQLLGEDATGEDGDGSFDAVRGDILFEAVDFGYDGGELALEDLSLSITAGESVALVGPSGSGKSTVLDLLTRFYDTRHGRITIDGRDVREVSRAALRAHVGAVFQHSYLFNSTIRENIRQGRLGATDAEVEAAAGAAEIHEDITRLPQGYDTVPGEGGGQLSGGQRQRIALARAILRNPAILILDEATSALDAATEAAVNATLEKLSEGRTTIAVTHRLTATTTADRIFVLDGGRVVEQGVHKELLNLKGTYHRMWQEFGLELTGDALLGETAEEIRDDERTAETTPDVAAVGVGEDFADTDSLMEVGPEDLSELIQQFQAEEQQEEQEVQRLRDVNQRWARMVGTDRLTGLPNKTAFVEALVPREIQNARRTGDPVGFVLLSADNLGLVNEQHGRNAGDEVIRGLAEFLQSVTLGEEVLGHLDGTHFALILYPATVDDVRTRAESLRAAVAAQAFPCADTEIHLTVSAGVHAVDSGSLDDARAGTDDAFEALNEALFRAKRVGGDRTEVAAPSPNRGNN